MQERNRALRMGSGREDRPLVVGKDFEPRGQVARMIGSGLEFWRDTKIGAEEAAPKLGDQFLACPFGAILGVAAEIASDPSRIRSPVYRLVAEDRDVRGGVAEGLEAGHLDDVERRSVIGLRSAMTDHRARIGKEAIGTLDARDGIARGSAFRP